VFFCLAFKNTGICSVLCISGLKNILRFCIVAAKDVKTQKCYNLQHFVNFEKLKIVRKNVSKQHFFPILGTLKMAGRR